VALAALQHEAVAELRRFVEDEGTQFPALPWVWRALEARGKLLAQGEGFCWGVLPLLVCEAAGGNPQRALPLSIALECLIAAVDTFDDVQDGDAPDGLWRACGIATATNVATLLLFLTQRALGRLLEQDIPIATVAEIAQLFAAAGVQACSGQQRDLDESVGSEGDEAAYLVTIALKSGALVECACRAGALLGVAAPTAVAAYAQCGLNMGMALQIANDIAGASWDSADRSDLRVGKRTLPLLFALECAPQVLRADLGALVRPERREDLTPEESAWVRHHLAATGALHYASTVADLYWEQALSCLESAGCGAESPLRILVTDLQGA